MRSSTCRCRLAPGAGFEPAPPDRRERPDVARHCATREDPPGIVLSEGLSAVHPRDPSLPLPRFLTERLDRLGGAWGLRPFRWRAPSASSSVDGVDAPQHDRSGVVAHPPPADSGALRRDDLATLRRRVALLRRRTAVARGSLHSGVLSVVGRFGWIKLVGSPGARGWLPSHRVSLRAGVGARTPPSPSPPPAGFGSSARSLERLPACDLPPDQGPGPRFPVPPLGVVPPGPHGRCGGPGISRCTR